MQLYDPTDLEVEALWGPLLATKNNSPDRITPFMYSTLFFLSLRLYSPNRNTDIYDCFVGAVASWKSMEHLSGELLLLLALLRKREHAHLSALLCFCNNIFILTSWNGSISWQTWVTFQRKWKTYDCLYGMHCTVFSPWGQKLTEIIEMVHSLDMTTVD